ncbi:MAG TPA: transglutaminase domain-containing protein, partial [Ideonella sp.]|nr:transglutaminase domain-containing protein [Ideonella sp.]
MRLPPFAIAAALAFWGWRSGHYAAAALLAALAEAPRFVSLRFELRHADFARVADLCTLLFVALLASLFVALEAPRTARAVLTTILWLPALLVPVLLAQRFSTAGRFPLSGLFLYLRKLRQRDPSYRERELDLGPVYFAICVIAAGIPNQRDAFFYVGIVLLAGWALLAARPSHAAIGAWLSALGASALLGYAGHHGLARAQTAFEDWVSDWILHGMAADPYRSTTDLGSIGRLKTIDAIVLRVYPQPAKAAPPRLLHRASFTALEGGTWLARGMPMSPLAAQADGLSWQLASGTAGQRIRMFVRLEAGKALLALPAGTLRLTGMAAAGVRRNALGAVQADFGGDWAPYTAESAASAVDYAPPGADDLQIPRRERAAIERLAAELGLKGLPAGQALARVREHLAGFRYATYREAAVPAEATPVEDFLFRSKSGHCEYFAAASTLLLRAAGVPARYATGFAVVEYSPLEQAYVVRARHAHAWTRAFVDGRWLDVDTTPPSWTEEEAGS